MYAIHFAHIYVNTVNKKEKERALIAKNRRASFDYHIESTFEAGMVLVGSEVKSLRRGKVDLADAWASLEKGELWLKQLYIAPFEQARAFPHEVRRARKMLLHKNELRKLNKDMIRGGFTLVPIKLYFSRGRVKAELALVKGKKTFDKRATIAKKTAEKEARAAIARARKV